MAKVLPYLLLLPYLALIPAWWRQRVINRRQQVTIDNMRAALDMARLEKFTSNYRADVERMKAGSAQ